MKDNQEKITFEEALQRVQEDGRQLASLNPEFQNNFDIVMAAVQENVWALEFASERLKDDPEIVMAAVQQTGWALRYASERLQDDPEIVMAAVKQDGSAYHFISDAKLKNDIRYVLNLASTKEIKNLQEKLTGNLQVLTVEQAEKFMQEPGNSLEY